MILVDTNILLYAHDSSNPRFDAARSWFEQAVDGDEEVGFALVSLLVFLRIITSPTLFERPMTAHEAIEVVADLTARPGVVLAQPTERHWEVLDGLARSGRAKGPLVMDAHLAALAIEHGATLCSTDRDFTRFSRLRFRDPLEASDE